MSNSALAKITSMEAYRAYMTEKDRGYTEGDIPLDTRFHLHTYGFYALSGVSNEGIFPRPSDMPVAGREALGKPYDHPLMNEHTFWIAREAMRLYYGEYKLPQGLASYLRSKYPQMAMKYWYHFPHESVDAPGDIAFTPGHKYGVADRQVHMKIGRYLAKFYSDVLPPETIRDLSNTAKPREICWANTTDEILEVYKNGPQSCMKGERAPIVYGYRYPDGTQEWAVAYLWNIIGPKNEITARVLVNLRHKVCIRFYGDDGPILQSLMEAAGYPKVDGMHSYDSRLSYILEDPNDGRYLLMPYLDGDQQTVQGPVTDEAGVRYFHWGGKNRPVVDHTVVKNLHATSACGQLDLRPEDDEDDEEDDSRCCAYCENYYDRDDMFHSEYHDDYMCDRCNSEHRTLAVYNRNGDETYVNYDEVIVTTDDSMSYLNHHRVLTAHDIVQVSNGDYIAAHNRLRLVDNTTVFGDDGEYHGVGLDSYGDTRYIDVDDLDWSEMHARWVGDKFEFVHGSLLDEVSSYYDGALSEFHTLLHWALNGHEGAMRTWLASLGINAEDDFNDALDDARAAQPTLPLLESA